YNIDCNYKQEDAYLYTNDSKYLPSLEKEEKAYEKLGLKGKLIDRLPLDIPIKAALYLKDQAQFHPVKYLEQLVNEARKKTLTIFEQTTAVSVDYVKNPTIIMRDGHRVTCKYIIQASQYPFFDGQGFY